MERIFYILPGFTEEEHSHLAHKEISNLQIGVTKPEIINRNHKTLMSLLVFFD